MFANARVAARVPWGGKSPELILRWSRSLLRTATGCAQCDEDYKRKEAHLSGTSIDCKSHHAGARVADTQSLCQLGARIARFTFLALHSMTQTATPTLDDALGGALPGRIHLITGAPGSGKTAACLHFLRQGVLRRERSVLLTRDRGADLRSLALYVGVDLHALARDRRVTLVRYRPHFGTRLMESASPRVMMDELLQTLELGDLTQLAGPATPLRIAIDPVAPFVPHGDISGANLDALTEWLETNNATALLTWTGDMAIGVDRRLEPLVDRAAVILNLERVTRGTFRAHVVRARHGIANAGPIPFQVVPGLGVSTPSISSVLHQTFGAESGGEQPAA